MTTKTKVEKKEKTFAEKKLAGSKPKAKAKEKKVDKPRKESAVLKRIQNDYDYCVDSTHDLRAEKKGYRVDLKPCFCYPSNGKEVKHFVAEEGLVTMLNSMREVADCFCPACQKTITWKRPATYTKETNLRVQMSNGFVLPKGGFEKLPLQYVTVEDLPDITDHGVVWVDYNAADAAKINKVCDEEIFDVA